MTLAKEARAIVAAIDERLQRRSRSSTTIALVHKKELPIIKMALEKLASDHEANVFDEKLAPKDP